MAAIAVVLSGCGFMDGSEIHESTLCLLALHQAGHSVECFAPDIPQAQVINHLTKAPMGETRNCLVEAARIARGAIKPLAELDEGEFDAILLPGGFGAAANLSTFGADQENCTVNADLQRTILAFHKAGKPIGATCITPAVLAKIFEKVTPVTMTLGSSAGANAPLDNMGMQSTPATASQMVADEENRVYTTPCYMEPPDLAGMFEGITAVVAKLG